MPDSYIDDYEVDDYDYSYDDDDDEDYELPSRNMAENFCSLEKCRLHNYFYDITIKIGKRTFKLHRIILMLHSDYFEKIFTANFADSESNELELNGIEDHIFSDIVDIIYSNTYHDKVSKKLNAKNFVSLLMGMDYLQMEIKVEVFQRFIRDDRRLSSLPTEDIFRLHDFLQLHSDYKRLLFEVQNYLSSCLLKISYTRNFLSMSYREFQEILLNRDAKKEGKDGNLAKICAKWIVEDISNRLKYFAGLVNAVRYRYNDPFNIIDKKLEDRYFDDNDPMRKQEKVAKLFHKFLTCSGEISLVNSPGQENSEHHVDSTFQSTDKCVNKIDKASKMKAFLEKEYFHDVLVRAGNSIFRLHRIQLCISSNYFYTLLMENFSKEDVKEIHLPDEIDDATFLIIVRYIYCKEINFTPKISFVNLLQASKVLEIDELYVKCERYIPENLATIKYILELLTFTYETNQTSLYRKVSNHLSTLWPKMYELSVPDFLNISSDQLEKILGLPDLQILTEEEIIKICVKWTCHDAHTRYCRIAKLAAAINRNAILALDDSGIDGSENFEKYSTTDIENRVEQKLREILNSAQLLRSQIPVNVPLDLEKKPFFMILENAENQNDQISFMNADLEKITSPVFNYPSFLLRNKSSALIGDNLFTNFQIEMNYFFNCFNLSSQKCISLANYETTEHHTSDMYCKYATLLSCNNDVFCAPGNGKLLKYSTSLNRWFTRSSLSTTARDTWYTSDEQLLYRFHKNPGFSLPSRSPVAQFYDDRNKSWTSLACTDPLMSYKPIVGIDIIDGNFCILYSDHTRMLDRRSHKWTILAKLSTQTDTDYRRDYKFTAFKQYKDNILYIVNNSEMRKFNLKINDWEIIKIFGNEPFTCQVKTVHFKE